MRVLLVNPWIYDFAAYDLWARPMGLLYLSAWLKSVGVKVRLVDCMDRLHPRSGAGMEDRRRNRPGTGRWRREVVDKPEIFREIPRNYCRYGMPVDEFRKDVRDDPPPDLVLMTSIMTYWYPGVRLAVSETRQALPGVPIALGGIYATLCHEHARETSGADLVIAGAAETALDQAMEQLGLALPSCPEDLFLAYRPDLDLYPHQDFAPIMTSRGCPLNCPYCASRRLFNGFVQKSPDDILSEIEDRHRRLDLTDFAFFDDALLIDPEKRLMPVLEEVVRRQYRLRFHAPNGLHVGAITPELADLMHRAGFQTIRLGLETLEPARRNQLGGKVLSGQFEAATGNLIRAGFDPASIGTYILFGLPGQDLEEVMITARAVRRLGARPYLAEFSPLPGTAFWREALESSPFDLEREPLYQNNSFFPCRPSGFNYEKVWTIKRQALQA